MKHLMPHLKKYTLECILAPLFKMLEAGFDLIVPLIVADMIDVGIVGGDKGYIVSRFFILITMAVLGLLSSFTAQYFAAKAAIGTSAKLRRELFQKIQFLSFSQLEGLGSGTMITRMTSDVNQVQNGINMFLRLFLRSPFIVFGAMIMAFMIDFQIALIFAFSIPILFIIVFGIMKITGPLYKNLQSKLDSLTVSTRENILGVRVIRAFRGERAEATAFKGKNADLSKSQIFVGKISALMNPLTYAIINIGIVLILWFGAGKVNGGILLKGSVIALVNYLSQILVELIKLANTVVLLSRSIASMGRISGVLDMESSMKFGCVKESFEQGELVRFENVSLKYSEGSEEALSDISFSINKGETTGIIGETGSGKTSIASLMSRFYDATSGQVYFKGKPIEIWSKNELYSKIATVFQKVQLLSGTVRSNVCLGKENASDEEIMRALEIAQAADFVLSKPGGLDSEISAGGANLSGGQKQRLTIARAVLTRPELLILDDSSSALDYATDLKLRKALKEISKETTTVIISQRTSSIRHADKILVLDDGRLSAIGTHDELLSISPLYKEIHEINTGKGDNND